MNTHPNKIITFGKYNMKTFDYVLSNDNNYCKWILTQNSNNENMKTFKQYIQNNIKIIQPPKSMINVTDLCRYYYCNNQILELFNNLIIEKKRIVKLEDNNIYKLPGNIYGTFIDYLIRYKICIINNLQFTDGRADSMLNTHISLDPLDENENILITRFNNYIIDNIDIENCETGYSIYGGINEQNKYLKLESLFNNSYENMKQNKANYNDIFNVSLLHSLYFFEINVLKYYNYLIDYNYNYDKFDNYLNNKFINKNILLNPVLGNNKLQLGGDADIINNDVLIDIKCSKHIGTNINDFIQLFIYITLYYYKTNIKCNKIIIFNPVLGYEYYINISSWNKYDKIIEILEKRIQ